MILTSWGKPLMSTLLRANSHRSARFSLSIWDAITYSSTNGSCTPQHSTDNYVCHQSLSWWQTVQVSCTRNSYENLGTITLSVCHKFSYEFFSRTRNLDELEQCSTLYEKLGRHVMLRRYWLEVRFVFFTIFCCCLLLVVSSFWPFCWSWSAILKKNKIWNSLSSLSSSTFLVRETWVVLCATCIQVSCAKFLVRVSCTRNLDRLPSALLQT